MKINTNSEIEEFIASLEKETIAKTLRTLDLLETFGFKLGMPHSKKLMAHLFELRVRGRQEIRLFYCFHNERCHLLCGFIKKSKKTPKNELLKAINRYKLLVLDTI